MMCEQRGKNSSDVKKLKKNSSCFVTNTIYLLYILVQNNKMQKSARNDVMKFTKCNTIKMLQHLFLSNLWNIITSAFIRTFIYPLKINHLLQHFLALSLTHQDYFKFNLPIIFKLLPKIFASKWMKVTFIIEYYFKVIVSNK